MGKLETHSPFIAWEIIERLDKILDKLSSEYTLQAFIYLQLSPLYDGDKIA